ncbi:MAG: ester cyclase [Paracoccaceae bacterium]
MDTLDQSFHRDVVAHTGGPGGLGGAALHGIDQFISDFAGPTLAAFPDLLHTVDGLFSSGDRVAMRYHGTGTHKGELAGRAATGNVLR